MLESHILLPSTDDVTVIYVCMPAAHVYLFALWGILNAVIWFKENEESLHTCKTTYNTI